MSDKKTDNKAAIIAIVVSVFVALLLVGLGYVSFITSNIDDSFSDPEVSKDQDLGESDRNQLPSLSEPVDSKEIQEKIDNLSKEFSGDEEDKTDKKLDVNNLSEESLGL